MPKQAFPTVLPPLVGHVERFSFQQNGSSPLWHVFSSRIRLWAARHRQRARLAELAELNDDLLDDIGVSRDDALIEAAKPFWRR
jgi:uncharacterized protein YjiS (DUF1127 family)